MSTRPGFDFPVVTSVIAVPSRPPLDRALPSQPRTPTTLNLLTIFRFVAALWVIVFHLHDMFWLPLPSRIMQIALNGAYAMSFFFVLSGTVLAYSYYRLEQSPGEIKRFYLARFARIYPTYLLVHLIGLPLLPVPLAEFPRWAYINVTSLFGVQAWFPQAFTGVNSGTWSISCEFFFYLVFPAALPLLRLLEPPTNRLRAAVLLSLFIGFLGLSDIAFSGRGTFPMTYASPLFRLPEFLLGMVVGVSLHHRKNRRSDHAWTIVAAAAVLLILSTNSVRLVGMWTRVNILVVPAVAWLIYAAASYELSHPGAFKRGAWRWLEYLGRASYCMFLVQMPILLWIPSAVKAGHPLVAAMVASPIAAFFGTALAIILLGIVAHECIEKPARRWILRRASPSPKAA